MAVMSLKNNVSIDKNWMSVPTPAPQNSYIEIYHQCEHVCSWDLWEMMKPWVETLTNGIGALKKEAPECVLAPSAMWGQSTEKPGPPQTSNLSVPWSWTPQSPQSVRNKCLLFFSQLVYFCYNSPIRLRQICSGSQVSKVSKATKDWEIH